jgi:hypothetical protein
VKPRVRCEWGSPAAAAPPRLPAPPGPPASPPPALLLLRPGLVEALPRCGRRRRCWCIGLPRPPTQHPAIPPVSACYSRATKSRSPTTASNPKADPRQKLLWCCKCLRRRGRRARSLTACATLCLCWKPLSTGSNPVSSTREDWPWAQTKILKYRCFASSQRRPGRSASAPCSLVRHVGAKPFLTRGADLCAACMQHAASARTSPPTQPARPPLSSQPRECAPLIGGRGGW